MFAERIADLAANHHWGATDDSRRCLHVIEALARHNAPSVRDTLFHILRDRELRSLWPEAMIAAFRSLPADDDLIAICLKNFRIVVDEHSLADELLSRMVEALRVFGLAVAEAVPAVVSLLHQGIHSEDCRCNSELCYSAIKFLKRLHTPKAIDGLIRAQCEISADDALSPFIGSALLRGGRPRRIVVEEFFQTPWLIKRQFVGSGLFSPITEELPSWIQHKNARIALRALMCVLAIGPDAVGVVPAINQLLSRWNLQDPIERIIAQLARQSSADQIAATIKAGSIYAAPQYQLRPTQDEKNRLIHAIQIRGKQAFGRIGWRRIELADALQRNADDPLSDSNLKRKSLVAYYRVCPEC